MRIVATLALALMLAACGRIIPDAAPPQTSIPLPPTQTAPQTPPVSTAPPVPVPSATSALMAGVAIAPQVARLNIEDTDAAGALASFLESCPVLLRRGDQSGLTLNSEWQESCAAAKNWPSNRARGFFEVYFAPVTIGDGNAFATGYFEPEILGSRTRSAQFNVPVYAMPPDLKRGWPDDVAPSERTGNPPLGRELPDGRFVPYYERAEIVRGALEGRAPVIAWAADEVEFFFLQIQGSGRIRTPSGEIIRIGYAGQNGRGYTGIGGVMRERGLLGDGPGQYPGSMQGIMAYIRENPVEGRELMDLNQSWVFFRELTGDGPLGSIGVPVRGQNSVAVDPRFVPYGAPVWLDLDRDIADGLWIAQDTGGAIKGANRFDTFWGAGAQARDIAGGMSARGKAYVLLPKASAERLSASSR